MSKAIAIVAFDYSAVDKDVKGKLQSLLRDINREKEKHQDSGMEIGKSVAAAHALLASDGRDGRFSQWVQSECGFSRQTAYNYMNAWQRFGNCKSLLQFTQESLYALASPNAPDKAVKEAEKLAEKGQRITLDKAKELLDRFREVAAKPPKSSPSKAPEPTPEYVDPVEAACEHDYDEEACRKCHAPKPVKGGATFDFGANAKEESAASDELNLAAKQAPYDEILNALTQITKTWNAIVKDERDGVYALEKRQRVEKIIGELRGPIAQARPMKVCEFCHGKGCKKCSNCGWWPRSVVEGLRK